MIMDLNSGCQYIVSHDRANQPVRDKFDEVSDTQTVTHRNSSTAASVSDQIEADDTLLSKKKR